MNEIGGILGDRIGDVIANGISGYNWPSFNVDSFGSVMSFNPLSLISSGIGGIGNIISSALYNHQAKKLIDYQYKKNVQMWNMQNEYNSPSSQMQRLTEAGLNPNLIYGSSANAGNADSMPSYGVPNQKQYGADLGFISSMDSALQMLTAEANIKNLEAQNANIKAQTNKTNIEAEGSKIANAISSLNLQKEQFNVPFYEGNAEISASKLKNENDIAHFQSALLHLQSQKEELYRKTWSEERDKQLKLLDSQINNLVANATDTLAMIPYKQANMRSSTASNYASATRAQVDAAFQMWVNNTIKERGYNPSTTFGAILNVAESMGLLKDIGNNLRALKSWCIDHGINLPEDDGFLIKWLNGER